MLPSNWKGEQDDLVITFTADPDIGALQISCASKDQGEVTDEDLMDFANDSIREGTTLIPVDFNEFTGFCLDYSEDEVFWKKWWLRNTNLMLYITYNVDVNNKDSEASIIDKILSSLKAKP